MEDILSSLVLCFFRIIAVYVTASLSFSLLLYSVTSLLKLWFFQYSCIDVRVEL